MEINRTHQPPLTDREIARLTPEMLRAYKAEQAARQLAIGDPADDLKIVDGLTYTQDGRRA